MISDLEGKVIGEGEQSHKIYAEFAEWCEDRSKEVGFEIKTGKAEVAELTATIDQEDATIGSLNAKIEELASSIATDEADLKAATTIRDKEAADFAAEEKELSEVIDTLGRAIQILTRELQGGASMLQLKNAKDITSALNILVQASAFNSADARGSQLWFKVHSLPMTMMQVLPTLLFTRAIRVVSLTPWKACTRKRKASWQMHAKRRRRLFTTSRCSNSLLRILFVLPTTIWPKPRRVWRRPARKNPPPRVTLR
jgi:hypothetical protein